MVWQKNHDNHDLDERLHRLREDPFDLRPTMVQVPLDYLIMLEAKLLRTSMIFYSSRQLTDGWIDEAVMPMVGANAQVLPSPRVAVAIARLTRQGLLRKRPKREGGGYEIRNFLKYNPTKEQVERRRAADRRLSWLQDTAAGRKIRDMIKERDGNRCRYCYIELVPGDQRSLMRMSYDHVYPNDPELARDPRWIVQACGFHNGMKQDRSPEEAGLELLPPWGQADAEIRRAAREVQDATLVVAAMLADEGDQEPEAIVSALRRVLADMQGERGGATSARHASDTAATGTDSESPWSEATTVAESAAGTHPFDTSSTAARHDSDNETTTAVSTPAETPRSEGISVGSDQKAIERQSNPDRKVTPGRVGSGGVGTGTAASVSGDDPPPPWSDEEIDRYWLSEGMDG